MDDCNIIAPLSTQKEVLSVLENEGPSFGLVVNASKSKASGAHLSPQLLDAHGLHSIPFDAIDPSAATVLGLPMGNDDSVRQALEQFLSKLKRFTHCLTQLKDPQVALLLLRSSLGFVRINHLMRAVSPATMEDFLLRFDEAILEALCGICGTNIPAAAWSQAGLPIRLGGLGITHPSVVAPAAFVASSVTFMQQTEALNLPPSASIPPSAFQAACRRLAASVKDSSVLHSWGCAEEKIESAEEHGKQRFWSSAIFESISKDLNSNASARDKLRLQCLFEPLSGAWLTAFPSPALSLSFSPMEFRRLPKWWLGLPQLSNPSTPPQCKFCHQPMNIFGDHSVSCNGISCVTRHNLVAEALASAAHVAGITIEREVAVAGKERPADLLLKGLPSSHPIAGDITVVHPLVSFDQGAGHHRTADAEKAKHNH